ncbi:hypothetical protein LT493_11555 [Streptomyces tricolor]|nr:hypothetical protein [Streptomyces tricolor]
MTYSARRQGRGLRRRPPAPSTALRQLVAADTELRLTVEVVVGLVPGLFGGPHEGRGEGMPRTCRR